MTIYVDSSALLKRYVEEPESETCERILLGDPTWTTARHTLIEVRRNLHRLLEGEALVAATAVFLEDWERMFVVELDATTCDRAADIAETTGARSLDALHLAAAMRVGSSIPLVTYDLRQAQAARKLGLSVLGM